MASAKSSRSRASAPSAPSKGSANGQDANAELQEKLKAFRTDKFDPDAFLQSKCQSMNEKEIKYLCSYLLDLKRASAEELRASVYSNYPSFIRTSKEISDLEVELLSIRNLLSTQAALIHGLVEGVHVDSLSNGPDGFTENDVSSVEDREPTEIEKWAVEFPDILDVLLAERRVEEALAALDEGEHVLAEAKETKSLSPTALSSLQTAIAEHRQKLADQLAEAGCQPSTRGVELRAAVSALKILGDGPRAHSLLLNAHYQRFQYNMQNLRPSSSSYGGAYTAALSQLVFSTIAQAVSDSLAVFADEPAYSSELVVWCTKQTEDFAVLVKRHALASSAAAGGLRAAAECVQIAIGHCSLLGDRGLYLLAHLLDLFRPSVEQALHANLKRIEESTTALAAADDWVLTYLPTGTRSSVRSSNASVGSGISFQPKLSSSAHRFNSMVQDFFEDVGPLLSMQLGGPTLEGLYQVFNSYVNLLINALPGSMEDEGNFEGSSNKIVRMAETEAQQLALLANASLLADELLPRAIMKLYPLNSANGKVDPQRRSSDKQSRQPDQREWKRRIQRSVDGLRDSFCRQHALDLIFTEDGNTHLSAEMYLVMDESVEEPEWFPSPIFQIIFFLRVSQSHAKGGRDPYFLSSLPLEVPLIPLQLLGLQHSHMSFHFVLFWNNAFEFSWLIAIAIAIQDLFMKLDRMASIAADMFVGRERFATLLLMRLTETVILWLSDDQSFWDDIEEGARTLGPLGLQQFYLDMQFVIHFSSQGRYLSRHLHQVIKDIISRAMAAFAATGMDPNSALPEDDWFADVSVEAINRLSGKGKVINGDRDLNSPTASISAQSVSSVRSHGSS
ncbi:exocyst complex component EXO84B [Cinnamomum micranthum f. kanehirae]|uniref:Exocyst complex component EXO84B n=1 Tax=Cinnamomum micranthum f. kanehirae TaxID=337451 RepID=A0A3S3NDA5_9MAGN|nr:exocyst complex component EXO84B [Cinnamomum micranthum f. kanehirae]